MCCKPEPDSLIENMKPGKNDRPGYSCERTPWVLVTGAEPLNCSSGSLPAVAIINYRDHYVKPVFQTRAHLALRPFGF
jgi:hypothetical protein